MIGPRLRHAASVLGITFLVFAFLGSVIYVAQETPVSTPSKGTGRSFEQARFHHNVKVAAKRLRAAERLQHEEVRARSRGSP